MKCKHQGTVSVWKRGIAVLSTFFLAVQVFAFPMQVSASKKAELPDFNAYLNNNAKLTKTDEKKGYTELQYKVASSDTKIVTDYIDMICEDYDFNLFDTYGSSTKLYSIEYTGSATVQPFNFGRYKEKDKAVYITTSIISGNLWVGLTYSNDLDYTDTSDRTAYTLKNANETTTTAKAVKKQTTTTAKKVTTKSNYNDDTYSYYRNTKSSTEKECPKCNGTRTVPCSRCYGSGTIKEYVCVPNYAGSTKGSSSKLVDVSCPSCKNGNVQCKTCHGTGKV